MKSIRVLSSIALAGGLAATLAAQDPMMTPNPTPRVTASGPHATPDSRRPTVNPGNVTTTPGSDQRPARTPGSGTKDAMAPRPTPPPPQQQR